MRISFPELVQFKAPAGLTAQLASIAQQEQLSVSAVVRRLVCEQVERRVADNQDQRSGMSRYDGPRGLVTA